MLSTWGSKISSDTMMTKQEFLLPKGIFDSIRALNIYWNAYWNVVKYKKWVKHTSEVHIEAHSFCVNQLSCCWTKCLTHAT